MEDSSALGIIDLIQQESFFNYLQQDLYLKKIDSSYKQYEKNMSHHLLYKIQEYMEHEKVRDLIIEVREYLYSLQDGGKRKAQAAGDVDKYTPESRNAQESSRVRHCRRPRYHAP